MTRKEEEREGKGKGRGMGDDDSQRSSPHQGVHSAWGVSPEMRALMDDVSSSLQLEKLSQRVASPVAGRAGVGVKRDEGQKGNDGWAIPSDSSDGDDENEDDDDDDEKEKDEDENEEDGHPNANFHIPSTASSGPSSSATTPVFPDSPRESPASPKAADAAGTDTPSADPIGNNRRKIFIKDEDEDEDEGELNNNTSGSGSGKNYDGDGDGNGGNCDDGNSADFDPADTAEEDRKTRARLTIIRLRDELFAADPGFKRRTCSGLNSEAVAHLKAGDDLRCVAAYAKLFRKIRDNHLVHKELYVCHSNRSAAYLNLGLFEAGGCFWTRSPDVLFVSHRSLPPPQPPCRNFGFNAMSPPIQQMSPIKVTAQSTTILSHLAAAAA